MATVIATPVAPAAWRAVGRLLVLSLAYLLIARATHAYFDGNGLVMPIFQPQAGVALALLVLGGLGGWPALLCGSLAAHVWDGHGLAGAAALSAGTTASALLGAYLLTRRHAFDPAIGSFRDYVRLVFWGGVVGAGASAGAGALLLLAGALPDPEVTALAILRWWMGQVSGVLVVTPLLLVWKSPPAAWLDASRLLALVLYFLASFLVGQIVFLGWLAPLLGNIALGYWMFLLVVWGAAQFGPHSVVVVLFMTTIQALTGAATGVGFFGHDIERTQLSNFWFYLVALSTVGMGLASVVTAFRRAEQRVRDLAQHDPLTGLPNRLLLSDRIGQAIVGARRRGGQVAMIFHDLDNFKPVNDRFGHRVGDLLLRAVAERVQASVRDSDTVGRIGGDEFVIVLPTIASVHDALQVAEKVRLALALPFVIGGEPIAISTSIGVAVYPEHGLDESTLTVNADNAMYCAKNRGRNNIQVFDPVMAGAARAGAPRPQPFNPEDADGRP